MNDIKDVLGKHYMELKSFALFEGSVPAPEEIENQNYIDFPEVGVSVVLPDKVTVGAIHLHSPGHENFRGYTGSLPHGLKFNMSRSAVRALLGNPEASREEQSVPVLGWKSAWDNFVVEGFRIHVAYLRGGAEGIELVTLTRTSATP